MIQEIQDKYLRTSRTKKKRWINDQISDMMESRKKIKDESIMVYKRIDKEGLLERPKINR